MNQLELQVTRIDIQSASSSSHIEEPSNQEQPQQIGPSQLSSPSNDHMKPAIVPNVQQHQSAELVRLNVPVKPPNVTFHFIRHAQAVHNILAMTVPYYNFETLDPPLTEQGHEQARSLLGNPLFNESNANKTIILCSPLIRTLETMFLGLQVAISRGAKVILYPDLREEGDYLASTGSSIQHIKELCAKEKVEVDMSLLEEGWEFKTLNTWCLSVERKERVRRSLYELRLLCLGQKKGLWNRIDVGVEDSKMGDVDIIIVSHGSMLRVLLGVDCHEFGNVEVVSAEIEDGNEKKRKEAWLNSQPYRSQIKEGKYEDANGESNELPPERWGQRDLPFLWTVIKKTK